MSGPSADRPWTFYVLGALFGAWLLFLYGPMIVIYVLSFQGPNGGVTFPMVGTSLTWFRDIVRPEQMANIPVAFERSIELAALVSVLTVVISVSAGLGFRRRFPGSGVLFYLAVAIAGHAESAGWFRHRPRLPGAGTASRPVHLGARCAADLDAAVRPVHHVRRGEPLQPRL